MTKTALKPFFFAVKEVEDSNPPIDLFISKAFLNAILNEVGIDSETNDYFICTGLTIAGEGLSPNWGYSTLVGYRNRVLEDTSNIDLAIIKLTLGALAGKVLTDNTVELYGGYQIFDV